MLFLYLVQCISHICLTQTLTTIMSPPPMVTSLAYYPKDNNIFGIGFDDSTILIYHVRQAEVCLFIPSTKACTITCLN